MGKINVCKIYVDLVKISSCRDSETAFSSIIANRVLHNLPKAGISSSYFTIQNKLLMLIFILVLSNDSL